METYSTQKSKILHSEVIVELGEIISIARIFQEPGYTKLR